MKFFTLKLRTVSRYIGFFEQKAGYSNSLRITLIFIGLAISYCANAQIYYVGAGGVDNAGSNGTSSGAPFATIAFAISTAPAGSTIIVGDGNYSGNITINKSLCLISQNGKANTTLTGTAGIGALGTVIFDGTTTNSCLKGFTVVGIDNGSPGVENAAVYIKGSHTNLQITDNTIQANGDLGLLAEFGTATLVNPLISNNVFSGQTYTGSSPATGDQFTVPNVPRQLIALNRPNVSNLTFTNNQITGSAGAGTSGNYIATIEANTALIQGNTFAGSTAGTSGRASLRVRGNGITVLGNTFQTVACPTCTHIESAPVSGFGLNPLAGGLSPVNTLSGVAGNNVFATGATYLNPTGSFTAVYTSPSQATAAAATVGGGSPVPAGVPSIVGSPTASPTFIYPNTPLSATVQAAITNNAGYNFTITNGTNLTSVNGASGNISAIIPTTVPGAYTVTVSATSGLYATSGVTELIAAESSPSATSITVSSDVTCGSSAQLTTKATGSSFVFNGPDGYVFSTVYRIPGTYELSAPDITQPGTYTLTVYSTPGGPSTVYSVTVNGSTCPPNN